MQRDLQAVLEKTFGFPAFRPHQQEIVESILAGQDVFAVMPTGGGKSLCYQLPASISPGLTLVVSPLISLMKDQVDAANANGIGAASLNSSITETERRDINSRLRTGDIKLLYISPERFNSPGFLEYLRTFSLAFFVVDEAHCISAWGHDFRPDYLSLSAMKREFPKIPVAAFTATATPRVADDILARLGLENAHLTRASFNRANLVYHVMAKDNPDQQLLTFLKNRPDEPGIVYRTTRKTVEATALLLRKNGIHALPYHAGLSDAERNQAQEDFRYDRCQVVVATIAFGMGIDKPNVRFVVHGDLPKNIEGYYQETGRAGRDGEAATCLLLHSPGDIAQLHRFSTGIADPVAREAATEQLRGMAAFARSEHCRRAELLAYFGEIYPEKNCGGCDICLGVAEREDATVAAQKALSAMVRTGNRFGAVYLTDILVGADSDKIRQNGHHRLPTFGVGRDMPRQYWRRVIEAAVAKGLAEVDDSQYPTPRITDKGWEVLKGISRFEMLKSAAGEGKAAGGGRTAAGYGNGGNAKGSRTAAAAESESDVCQDLFQLLRKERLKMANERGVPPYVIFADRSLRDMARFFPITDAEMLLVHGVGAHKLSSYGEQYLRLIRNYVDSHPGLRSSSPEPARRSKESTLQLGETSVGAPAPAARTSLKKVVESQTGLEAASSEAVTGELLAQGWTVEEAAAERGLRPETIVTHMERLSENGTKFPAEKLLPAEKLELLRRLFKESGGKLLKPVVEASGGRLSYLEARLGRVLLWDELS